MVERDDLSGQRQGRRRDGAKTSAPSRIRSVRAAIAASTIHGSHSSMSPMAMASSVKTPSQPAASAREARSAAVRGSPEVMTMPNFMRASSRDWGEASRRLLARHRS